MSYFVNMHRENGLRWHTDPQDVLLLVEGFVCLFVEVRYVFIYLL